MRGTADKVGVCEACGRTSNLKKVGAKETGDDNAMVCADASACQRTMVAKNRRAGC